MKYFLTFHKISLSFIFVHAKENGCDGGSVHSSDPTIKTKFHVKGSVTSWMDEWFLLGGSLSHLAKNIGMFSTHI